MANISVDIVGNDKSASSAVESVGDKVSGLSGRLKSAASGIGSVFGGIELSEIGDKITDFAKESIDKLSDVAGETRNLQRVMGGSSEQVSDFAASANRLGVSQSGLVVAMSNASKAIVAGKSPLDKLGISTKNSNGTFKTMTELMPEIAEKFATTSNSTERAAMAQNIFGKAGRQMLPLLAKGSDGLKDMEKEANNTGLTMSGSAMSSTYKYQQAQISLRESVEGLQLRIGTALYPWLVKLTGIITSQVIPAIMGFFNWLQKNPTVLKSIVDLLGPLVAGIVILVGAIKVWTIVQGILNVIMDANPIGLIILGIAALIAAVLLIVANWKIIGPWVQNLWNTVLGYFRDAWNNIESFMRVAISVVIAILQTLNPLPAIQSAFGKVTGFFQGLGGDFTSAFSWIGSTFSTIGLNIVQGLWNGITDVKSWLESKIGGLAGDVVSWAKNALGIHSPSTVFHEIGQNVGLGFANGITATSKLAQNATSGLVSTPTMSNMGLGGAVASGAAGSINAQTAHAAGGVYIGQFNAGGQSPAAIGQELGWQGRWAT